MKFINKLFNLLVLMNPPKMKYRVIIILKYASDVPKVDIIEGSITLKELNIYQDFITVICYVIPQENF